jgi:SpoVK/Ycf46/Vps4 family AAA+-type ATPase
MAPVTDKKYQFIDLKIYSSTEWLADNKKKYRHVFDRSEVGYIYCEVSLLNLSYKKEDWDLKMSIKCSNDKKEVLGTLKCDRIVSEKHLKLFVREGWGVKNTGSYWDPGTYKWECWIDNELVAEKNFYVQDFGPVSGIGQPYFKIDNIKFYEGPDANINIEKRRYYNTFHHQFTRYIWCEFNAVNLIENINYWCCELTFNFRNKNNQLKGTVNKVFFVYPQEGSFSITVGWGSDIIGTWELGNYYVDVLFMDKLIASKSFSIGEDYIEAATSDFQILTEKELTQDDPKPKLPAKKSKPLEEKDVLGELDELIGLSDVKNRVREYYSYLQFLTIRKEKGIKETEPINLNAVFKGNPGTGKTTVARKLGKIYKQLGLLSKGHVHEVDRADIVAEFIGQTAPKTKAAIKKALGGILFIDEAYALARKDDDAKDFGKEAIEILIKEMTTHEDLAVIVAGYPEEMEHFLESNPGLKSRFNQIYDFKDYLPQELLEIAKYAATNRGISFSDEALEALNKKLVEAYRNRDKFFGNARLVNSLVDDAKLNLGLRIMDSENPASLTMEELSTIEVADIDKINLVTPNVAPEIPIDEDLLRASVDKLHQMIGLEKVKNDIKDLIKLVRFYKETNKDIRKAFSLHSVFTGNPGTGKTTVARILSQIYKALGIIERGHLIECDRQSLVGGYVGQTAIKTGDIVDKAMGGVLFIDEAYSLTEGGNSDYGKEAIEIILKRMEDYRGNFIVIAAGYTNNMRRFLESNPGLKSRFDRTFLFEDFKPEELLEIAENQLAENGLKADKKATEYLKEMLTKLYDSRDVYFGNGRSVRKVIEQAVRNQHLRMSGMDSSKRTDKAISTLKEVDLKPVDFGLADREVRKAIGFTTSS